MKACITATGDPWPFFVGGEGMEEIKLGHYALPVILTVVLGFVYKVLDGIPDKTKPLIAMFIGIGLALVGLEYSGKAWVFRTIVDYVLYGFMMGASAIGIYEIQRAARKPRL